MKPYTLTTQGYNVDTTATAPSNHYQDYWLEYNTSNDYTYFQDTADSHEYLQCPRCGTLNWGWYRHCLQCGARLITKPEPTLQDIYNKLKEILNELRKTTDK